MTPAAPVPDGADFPRRRAFRPTLRHSLGLLVALALAWLIMRAYRDPALMIELANWRLC